MWERACSRSDLPFNIDVDRYTAIASKLSSYRGYAV